MIVIIIVIVIVIVMIIIMIIVIVIIMWEDPSARPASTSFRSPDFLDNNIIYEESTRLAETRLAPNGFNCTKIAQTILK